MNAIATTTINVPTRALIKFSKLKDWFLIIAGDEKTINKSYIEFAKKNNQVIYLSLKAQRQMAPVLSDTIGHNTLARRNFAIIMAYTMGAKYIALVDDDNIPYKNWGKIKIDGTVQYRQYQVKDEVFDSFSATNQNELWHRGFPIQLLSDRNWSYKLGAGNTFDIQANFWNGDPDIDALCRMQHKHKVIFQKDYFPFSANKFSPFNSQNTILSRNVIPDYFLFPGIGRMDDIWASYFVQSLGHNVLYDAPTVFQERNKHDLTEDYIKEHIGNLYTLKLVRDLYEAPKRYFKYLPKGAEKLFNLYQKELK